MYVAWAAFFEGPSDASYYTSLIPRVLEEILRSEGLRPATVPDSPAVVFGQNGRRRQTVATEICESKDAFHILFLHADTGGRAVEQRVHLRREAYIEQAELLCGFNPKHVVFISPRNETEAWALADTDALLASLGVVSFPNGSNPPADASAAENLGDPKAALQQLIQSTSRRRRRVNAMTLLPRIAQDQRIEKLRTSSSFRDFESSVRSALREYGLIQ